MLSQSEKNILFHNDDFLGFWIGNDQNNNPMPCMHLKDLDILCKSLSIPYEMFNEEKRQYRKDYFEAALSYAEEYNLTQELFNYFFHKRYILKGIEDFNISNEASLKEKRIEINNAWNKIVKKAIGYLNNILLIDNYESYYDFQNNRISFYEINSNHSFIIENHIMNFSQLNELYINAKNSLKVKDYDSVITKSRTILEYTFLYILRKENISIKENGKLRRYRTEVNKVLGLNPDGENWKDNKEKFKSILELVSGLNKIIDAIATMRDNYSDAHANLKKFINREAESELVLNSSITISLYYLDIYQRQKSD